MTESNMVQSYILGEIPSFSRGFSQALDFSQAFLSFNYSKTPEEADYKALASDWQITGDDIREAIKQYEQENAK